MWPVKIFGLIIVIFGLLHQYEPFIKWSVKFNNQIQGTKTHITKETISIRKRVGLVALIIGILIVLFA